MSTVIETPSTYVHLTLQEAEDYYRDGSMSEDALLEYLKAWNATPGRFTQAVLWCGRVRQLVPTEHPTLYRSVWAKCGVREEV